MLTFFSRFATVATDRAISRGNAQIWTREVVASVAAEAVVEAAAEWTTTGMEAAPSATGECSKGQCDRV
jgi:hypothetical protein